MCGISAILSKPSFQIQDKTKNLSQELEKMIESMRHRGPDSNHAYVSERVGLAMTRLAIVGVDNGEQPIWNEEHSVVVVCNGEIYNYRDLRAQLEASGHLFSTFSDVEVIVHLYEQYQEESVKYLQGIFAFVLWDVKREKLFVARDRCGVKPLYYTQTKDKFLFASEMRALSVHPDINMDVDKAGFAQYHLFRFVPGSRTIMEGIKKVRPAEYIVIENGREFRQSYYWSPAEARLRHLIPVSFQEKKQLLKQHIFDAVYSQRTKEVKSGILLSGGLDSSALLAVHHSLFHDVPDTFTVSFTPPHEQTQMSEYDEIEHAGFVAGKFGARHISERYTPEDVLLNLPKIIQALDTPVADPTAIPLWFACRLAHQSGVKVLFSGEGLDELFNGYSVYRQVYWLNALRCLPKTARNLSIFLLEKLGLPGTGVLKKSLQPPACWYQGVGGVFHDTELKALIKETYMDRQQIGKLGIYAPDIWNAVQNHDTLEQLTLFDLLTWLPENTLVKSDKISMSHSIELRVPFLDDHIVEFALGTAKRDKMRGKIGKWIVRKALADVVPREVIRRKKAGFPIPLSAWMFNEWKDFVRTTLLNPNASTKDIYNPEEIESLFHTSQKERRRAARLLWTLLCFEIWYSQVSVHATSLIREPIFV